MELRKTEKEDRNDFVSILIKMRNEEKANSSHIGKYFIKTKFNINFLHYMKYFTLIFVFVLVRIYWYLYMRNSKLSNNYCGNKLS